MPIHDIHPSDTSQEQAFALPEGLEGRKFKISFDDPTDLFGRIVVYKLGLL